MNALRHVCRSLGRTAWLSLAAVLCFALSMTVIGSIGTLVDVVMFRGLPFPEPSQLVRIQAAPANTDDGDYLNYRELEAIRGSGKPAALSSVEAAARTRLVFRIPGYSTSRLEGEAVTSGYFDSLGVTPFLGRDFSDEEYRQGIQVIMLGYSAWQKYFDADPDIVGTTLLASATEHAFRYTVVGILPPDFHGTIEDDMPDLEFWVPYEHGFSQPGDRDSTARYVLPVARLAPGASIADLNAELGRRSEQILNPGNERESEWQLLASGMAEEWRSEHADGLLLLSAAALLMLVVATLNIAMLLLARMLENKRDIALQIALGARPGRVAWQLAREVLILAVAGGVIGALAAAPVMNYFLDLSEVQMPSYFEIQPSWQVFLTGFSILVSVALLATWLPLRTSQRISPSEILKESGERHGASRSGSRHANMVIASEIAITTLLVIGTLLLVRSLQAISNEDLGYDSVGKLRMSVFIDQADIEDETALPAFAEALAEEILGSTSVGDVALVWPTVPLLRGVPVQIDSTRNAAGSTLTGSQYIVSDNFFDSLDIALLRGRTFTSSDTQSSEPAVMVSRATAELLGGNVLDSRIHVAGEPHRIIGVVADAKFAGARETGVDRYEIYRSYRQSPQRLVSAIIDIREGTPAEAIPDIRRRISGIAPASAIDWVDPVEGFLAWMHRDLTFRTMLVLALGVAALLLTSIGIFGLITTAMLNARMEIGVRKAFGARHGSLLLTMLRKGLNPAVAGLCTGLAAALLLAGLLQGILFGVSAYDPLAFGSAIAVVLLAAMLATLVPAWRAIRREPIQALRD